MAHLLRVLLPVLLGGSLSAQLPIPRIVAIGDSVTEGNTAHPSYRFKLWELLRAQGYCFDFVGTKRGVFTTATSLGATAGAVFDQDHYATWGISAGDVLAQLTASPNQFDADIAIIEVGSNTIIKGMLSYGQTPAVVAAQVVADLAAIIAELQSSNYNPSMTILVAQLTPLPPTAGAGGTLDQGIIATNALIGSTWGGSAITVVDQFSGFNTTTDTWDLIHPNASGELKIATNWANALAGVLGAPPSSPACYQDYGRGGLFVWPTLPAPPRMEYVGTSLPVLGMTVNLNLFGLRPSSLAIGIINLAPAVAPIVADWEYLWVDPTGAIYSSLSGTTAAGDTSWAITLPTSSTFVGVEFYIQAGTLDSTPAVDGTTNGGIIRIG